MEFGLHHAQSSNQIGLYVKISGFYQAFRIKLDFLLKIWLCGSVITTQIFLYTCFISSENFDIILKFLQCIRIDKGNLKALNSERPFKSDKIVLVFKLPIIRRVWQLISLWGKQISIRHGVVRLFFVKGRLEVIFKLELQQWLR